MRRAVAGLLAVALTPLFAVTGNTQESPANAERAAAFPGTNGTIAYVRTNGSNTAGLLYVMNSDGSDQRPIASPLPAELASAQWPEWSPDGIRLAFTHSNGIYIAFFDGSGVTPVAGDPGQTLRHPTWSPDGTKLAYATGAGAIEAVPSSGGAATPVVGNDFGGDHPTWSPDGDVIAFVSGGPIDSTIYLVPAGGGTPTPLAEGGDFGAVFPEWSPDGDRVAYLSGRSTPEGSIVTDLKVIDEDGTGDHVVIEDFQGQGPLSWSPDGTKIAYGGRRSENPPGEGDNAAEIWYADAITGAETPLTNTTGLEFQPAWAAECVAPAEGSARPNQQQQGECTPPSIELEALEVTQGIQDLKNSVPLIEGRRTFVRAHVRSQGAEVLEDVEAELIGRNSQGEVLPGSPLAALNIVPGNDPINSIDVVSDPERERLDDSFLFELPIGWIDGALDLEFVPISSALDPACAGEGEECRFVSSLQESHKISVRAIVRRDLQTIRRLGEAKRELQQVLPVAASEIDLKLHAENPLPGEARALLERLKELRSLDRCYEAPPPAARVPPCPDYYAGLLIGESILNAHPSGIPNLDTNVVGLTGCSGGNDPCRADVFLSLFNNDQTTSHELGHAVGRRHVPCSGTEKPPFDETYPGGKISSATEGDEAFFGLRWQPSGPPRVIDPGTADLMSYCDPTWISDKTYAGIRAGINERFPSAAMAQRKMTAGPFTDFNGSVIVSGSIDLPGTSGRLNPLLPVDLPEVSSAPGGYSIVFEDVTGTQLTSHAFSPDTDNEGIPLGFTLVVEKPEGAQAVALYMGEQLLDRMEASPDLPAVELISPLPGATVKESILVEWSASDADGDSLTFTLQYSDDDGVSWRTLALRVKKTEFAFDPSRVPGGDSARLRVLATDGFNVAWDETEGSFKVPNNAPITRIVSSLDHSVYRSADLINVMGSVIDIEDGSVDEANLVWTSDIDGEIGRGSLVSIDMSSLEPGTHRIALSATDSDGSTGRDSMTINVFAEESHIPTCRGWAATFLGTASRDRITGTRALDVIVAGGKRDVVRGRGGNDRLCGGGGRDVIKGGRGRDLLVGGGGRDRCLGGPGRDRYRSCERRS